MNLFEGKNVHGQFVLEDGVALPLPGAQPGQSVKLTVDQAKLRLFDATGNRIP
ncbi:hypothetical protein JNB88_13480 [Rhizobium cauense]|uniref:hypothetical protein n=1 Tax=Rhizobium cauense TaxID=1166683 RepID=UPI001C6F45ED|nr:hypothetical protein [Rhizobium cauense]